MKEETKSKNLISDFLTTKDGKVIEVGDKNFLFLGVFCYAGGNFRSYKHTKSVYKVSNGIDYMWNSWFFGPQSTELSKQLDGLSNYTNNIISKYIKIPKNKEPIHSEYVFEPLNDLEVTNSLLKKFREYLISKNTDIEEYTSNLIAINSLPDSVTVHKAIGLGEEIKDNGESKTELSVYFMPGTSLNEEIAEIMGSWYNKMFGYECKVDDNKLSIKIKDKDIEDRYKYLNLTENGIEKRAKENIKEMHYLSDNLFRGTIDYLDYSEDKVFDKIRESLEGIEIWGESARSRFISELQKIKEIVNKGDDIIISILPRRIKMESKAELKNGEWMHILHLLQPYEVVGYSEAKSLDLVSGGW